MARKYRVYLILSGTSAVLCTLYSIILSSCHTLFPCPWVMRRAYAHDAILCVHEQGRSPPLPPSPHPPPTHLHALAHSHMKSCKHARTHSLTNSLDSSHARQSKRARTVPASASQPSASTKGKEVSEDPADAKVCVCVSVLSAIASAQTYMHTCM